MTAMSSMQSPTWGKSSLTSMPLWPYFWNLKGDGNAAPVLRSVPRFGRGSILPAYFSRSGLGSKVSTWLGPPLAKMWMTRLAWAGKCGGRGASGFRLASRVALATGSAALRSGASPIRPMPMPQRASISRRVIPIGCIRASGFASLRLAPRLLRGGLPLLPADLKFGDERGVLGAGQA